MKILFVTPYLPSPPHFGAQRRLDGLLRGLSQHHEVSLLSFAKPGAETEGALLATGQYCSEVVTVPFDVLNVDVNEKRLLQLLSLASRNSFEALLMRRQVFQVELDRLLRDRSYDLVQVEFSQMGLYELWRDEVRSPL